MPGVSDLPEETGWYRLTADGWVRVTVAEVEAAETDGSGWDLVYILVPEDEEVPLW